MNPYKYHQEIWCIPVKESQLLLKEKIDTLAEELQKISDLHKCPLDLEVYVKKLAGAKRRVTVVSNVLQNTQQVYEPAEDTFLMMDALEQDFGLIKTCRPSLIVEVCAGTGIIGTALSKALCLSPGFFIATDINDLACKASHDTFLCNGVNTCEVICADLLTFLASGVVDVLICNPPYVPTTEEELNSSVKLTRSWAGGENGRKVMDRLFKDVPRLLSQEGIFYLLVVKENRPCFVMKMKVSKDTLLQPAAKGGMKTADCLSSLHVPVGQEIVENMTLSQEHTVESSVAHSSSDGGDVRLEEVDSNAVSAMLWSSDSMLRQSLLSPALLSFTYPGHDKPVKDIDLEIKGVPSCNSGLVPDLTLSTPETAKTTICPSTGSQDLRPAILNNNSSSEASFYATNNSNQVSEMIPKKRKHSSDHQDSESGLPLPPIAELTSNHMLAAVNELNLQRLQRSMSSKQKSDHRTGISHGSGSPSSSCAFSSHSDCSPLSQQHRVSQAMLPSDLMLVASDTSDIHQDHLQNHDENLAGDSPTNSGLLSHLPPREASLPAISGSQVSSVLSALAEGVSVDSTSASEDVDMEREDRPHSTHLCVSVSPQIGTESIPVFSQLKDSSNSSQCSESSKLQGRETEEILSPIEQSSRSDSLSLGVKCEPTVLLSHVPIDSSSHSVNGNSSEIAIDDFLSAPSKHSRPCLKDLIKPENNGFCVSPKFSDSKVNSEECYPNKKKLSVDQKKSSGKSSRTQASILNPTKQSRQKKKSTNHFKNSPNHHRNQNQDPVINQLREDVCNDNFLEEVFCFKCKLCTFLSLDKIEVTRHVEENHSSDLLSKCRDAFADSTSDHAASRDWSNHLKRRRLKCPGCPNVFFSSKALEVHLSQDHQVSDAELQIILKNMDIESTVSSPIKSSSQKEDKMMAKNGVNVETKPVTINEDMQTMEGTVTTKRKCVGKKNGKDNKPGKDYNETLLEAYMDEQGKLCIKEVDNFSSDEREDEGGESEEERSSSGLGLFNVETTLEVSDEDYEEGKVCSESEKDLSKDLTKKGVGTDQEVAAKGQTPKRRGRPKGSRNTGITALRRMNPSVRLGEKELGYRCGIDGCAVRMRSLDNIEYHRRCHVPGGPAENGGMQHVCPECGELFSHWRSVGVHLWRAHVIDMELYSCDQCTYKTNRFVYVIKSMRIIFKIFL
ncbi:hypothetical protein J437_LFUL009119 [Ladona fulva]|uniref:Methyltransferase HEMK2 n=1 Tax=Ladona fulva TaxID=123851 RepID=A0A8K0K950_LADFU|nr:hypothetical protein J437_LFUL009119 [Ladona fulva]